MWIESKGKIISDRYEEKVESWRSSYYYINEYFVDGVNEVRLRIDEDYSDFKGEGLIFFRVRGEEQIGDGIEVLRIEEEKDSKNKKDNTREIITDETHLINNVPVEIGEIFLEPISLGQKVDTVEEKDINSENIVYQSKGTKIIEIAVYGFSILCVLLCVLVIWRKLD